MFPDGLPGLALLLLRLSTTITLMLGMSSPFQDASRFHLAGVILLGAALCAGFLTPLAALLAVGLQLLGLSAFTSNPVWLGVAILNALALAMMGPGAYSLDALRFGRRRMTVRNLD